MWVKRYPGSKIGVTGLITQPGAQRACNIVQWTDLDKILLETDAPYFPPSGAKKNPWRCSFPGHVVHVAARVAEIKQTSLQEVLQQNLVSASQIYRKFFERRNVLGEEEEEVIG